MTETTGDMSRVEQQIFMTIGTPILFLTPFVALAAFDSLLGKTAAWIGFLILLALTFTIGAWLWNPDDYPEDMQ